MTLVAGDLDRERAFIGEDETAAVAGGTHPCDVGFGRDVVAVLAAAQRALETGCRESVGT